MLGEGRINTSAPHSTADSKLMEYKLMTSEMCVVSWKPGCLQCPRLWVPRQSVSLNCCAMNWI